MMARSIPQRLGERTDNEASWKPHAKAPREHFVEKESLLAVELAPRVAEDGQLHPLFPVGERLHTFPNEVAERLIGPSALQREKQGGRLCHISHALIALLDQPIRIPRQVARPQAEILGRTSAGKRCPVKNQSAHTASSGGTSRK